MKYVVTKEMIKYLQDIYRLKNVIRYNTRNKLKDESVAEHSFYVALLSLYFCDEYNLSNKIKLKCVIKALLHDMPEIELNDITHDVKEKLNLRPMLKKYEDEYYKKHYTKYSNLMTKDNGIVDIIVDIADAFSVYQYVINEQSLGNKSKDFKTIKYETLKRLLSLFVKFDEIYKNGGK